jgi:hypothetical protein
MRWHIEELESRRLMSISTIPTDQIQWFSAAASTTECGSPSSAYLETPHNDVGRSGGCALTDGTAADGKAFDKSDVGKKLNAITTAGDQSALRGPL